MQPQFKTVLLGFHPGIQQVLGAPENRNEYFCTLAGPY